MHSIIQNIICLLHLVPGTKLLKTLEFPDMKGMSFVICATNPSRSYPQC